MAKNLNFDRLYLLIFEKAINPYYVQLSWELMGKDTFNGHPVSVMEMGLNSICNSEKDWFPILDKMKRADHAGHLIRAKIKAPGMSFSAYSYHPIGNDYFLLSRP